MRIILLHHGDLVGLIESLALVRALTGAGHEVWNLAEPGHVALGAMAAPEARWSARPAEIAGRTKGAGKEIAEFRADAAVVLGRRWTRSDERIVDAAGVSRVIAGTGGRIEGRRANDVREPRPLEVTDAIETGGEMPVVRVCEGAARALGVAFEPTKGAEKRPPAGAAHAEGDALLAAAGVEPERLVLVCPSAAGGVPVAPATWAEIVRRVREADAALRVASVAIEAGAPSIEGVDRTIGVVSPEVLAVLAVNCRVMVTDDCGAGAIGAAVGARVAGIGTSAAWMSPACAGATSAIVRPQMPLPRRELARSPETGGDWSGLADAVMAAIERVGSGDQGVIPCPVAPRELELAASAAMASSDERADRIASLEAGLAELIRREEELEARARKLSDEAVIEELQGEVVRLNQSIAEMLTQLESRGAIIEVRNAEISLLRTHLDALRPQAERLHTVGAELQKTHQTAGELRTQVEAKNAELATLRQEAASLRRELEGLRAQAAKVHEVGAELKRTHEVAGELRTQVEARNAEIAALKREKAALEASSSRVESLEKRLEEAAEELARMRPAAEELQRLAVEVCRAEAAVEGMRLEVGRATADRDALDALLATREAELAHARSQLGAERDAHAKAKAEIARLGGVVTRLRGENATLRQRIGDLLASRWRRLGQRMRIAMVLPWEREIMEPKPMAPAAVNGTHGPGVNGAAAPQQGAKRAT